MATKAQGATFSCETARAGTKVITGISNATSAVVTSTAHGYANGNTVFLTGIVGMTQLNNRAFTISGVAANTFTLTGEDSTAYGAWVSGGTAALLTLTAVGSVADVVGFDGKASEIDVTHLLSAAKEWQPGLQDFGNLTLTLITDNTDAGQAALRAIKTAASIKGFTLVTSDGKTASFMAGVFSFTIDVKKDSVLMSTCGLRITNQPQWFA